MSGVSTALLLVLCLWWEEGKNILRSRSALNLVKLFQNHLGKKEVKE